MYRFLQLLKELLDCKILNIRNNFKIILRMLLRIMRKLMLNLNNNGVLKQMK